MNGWYIFWLANFVVAGTAFAAITLIVLVRGLGDLRDMFANLRRDRPAPDRPADALRRSEPPR